MCEGQIPSAIYFRIAMEKRVVITGLGIIAPNGVGVDAFRASILQGKSGIRFIPELKVLNFGCQIGGVYDINGSKYPSELEKSGLSGANEFVKLSCLAGIEAWIDAGFSVPGYMEGETDYDTGVIMGSGIGAIDIIRDRLIPFTNGGEVKKLRSTIVEYSMFSASTANLAGILALGNQAVSVSSACSSSSEAVIMGYDRIKSGKAKRMLVGGVEVYTPHSWAGFDAMHLLTRQYNEKPELGSCPMSAHASGFVPSSGAGVIVIEELQSALERGAKIYAEIKGCHSNSGGQRNGGSMTIPSPDGVIKCIRAALKDAQTAPEEVDLISGHLTSTMADALEVSNWKSALRLDKCNFPFINAPKSITGHLIGAAGVTEIIASVLQIKHSFIHPSINCNEVNIEIERLIDRTKIPHQTIENIDVNCIAKASFGFGDVNACLILKKMN